MTTAEVDVGVLGPTTARVDGTAVTLSALRLRSLLGVLVLWRGQTVPAERIIDVVWGGAPTPGAGSTLQGYVASLRRALEPHRRPRAASALLIHEPGGYRLGVHPDQTDAHRFESSVLGAQAFVSALPDQGRPGLISDAAHAEAVQDEVRAALSRWRGDAYADLGDFAPAATERRRLDELRVDARTFSVVIDLALGRPALAAATLEELVSAHPLREQLWGLWAVALVRSDRQAHALEVLGRLRATLGEELGIDPSPSINRLLEDILRQDPTVLGVPVSATSAPVPVPVTVPATVAAAPPSGAGAPQDVPLVGRGRELAELQQTLLAATKGQARSCMLVGEAGIGKSRLTRELTRWARETDAALVVTVRSVDGDGAPPLWALTRAFEELADRSGVRLPDVRLPDVRRAGELVGDEAAEAGRFALCAALSDFLHDVARAVPLLVVLEDAHWADPTTLRVLRHVVEHAGDVPLMVLVTSRPEVSGPAVADLAASITRSGGTWLQLEGLSLDQVAELAVHVLDHELPHAELALLHDRAGGNPLYVGELLRASAQGGDQLPPSLAGLVRRRMAALPPATVTALEVASVVGRGFAPDVVSAAMGQCDLHDLAEALEPARDAGLLRERADGSWLFTHALVRDAVLEAIRPTERSAWHARVAASLDSPAPGSRARGDVARHWRAAGAPYAAQAWRAAAVAAGRAEEVYAFQESAQLLAEALESQRIDVASTDLERFDLLERRAGACRLSSDWDGAATAVIEAIAVAERMGRPELAARAATSLPEGSIWHVQRYGTVSADLVHALRRSLALVDPSADALRCRILLTIAMESFYIASPDELDALVDEALALAARTDDAELRCLALQQAYSARWRPGTAAWRVEVAAEALDLARSAGNLRFEATCGALLGIALVETGRLDEAHPVVNRTLDQATRHGYASVVMTLELMRVPLKLLAGRDDEADASLLRVLELHERVTGHNFADAVAGAQLLRSMWQGRTAEFVAAAGRAAPHPEPPLELFAVMALLRLGLDEAAEQLYASMPAVEPDDTYMGMIVAAVNAEVALRLRVPELSDRMYEWLRPFSGGVASAGSTTMLGPVDAFLALAAAGSARPVEAADHADRAVEQCARWGMPRASSWLADLRSSHGF